MNPIFIGTNLRNITNQKPENIQLFLEFQSLGRASETKKFNVSQSELCLKICFMIKGPLQDLLKKLGFKDCKRGLLDGEKKWRQRRRQRREVLFLRQDAALLVECFPTMLHTLRFIFQNYRHGGLLGVVVAIIALLHFERPLLLQKAQ